METGNNKIIYHYCSLNTFHEIIKNSTMRISDMDVSNDSNERKLFIENVKSMEGNYKSQGFISQLFTGKNNYGFAMCFSSLKDSLGQWRGYGDDGKGISIGFDENLVKTVNNLNCPLIQYDNVLYNKDEQSIKTRDILYEISSIFPTETITESNRDKITFKYYGKLEILKLKCKNKQFTEEHESRIMICVKNKNDWLKALNEYNLNDNNFVFSKINSVSSTNKIISYIDINFEKIKQDLIKEIWIGPKSYIQEDDIIKFLLLNEYENGNNVLKNINVYKSNLTYR